MSEEAKDREVQEQMMISILEERGYSVDRGDKDLSDKDELGAKVKALEERLTQAEQQPASPAEQRETERQQFGQSLLDRLNRATRGYYRD